MVEGGSLSSIHRFAVKGLSSDSLREARVERRGALPRDRQYALLFRSSAHLLKRNEWLHKQHFVSVFSTPAIGARLESEFEGERSVLTVWPRGQRPRTPLLQASLETLSGRRAASDFFSELAGEAVDLVDGELTHQFGNTNKGAQATGDLRTLHLINAETVRSLALAAGVPISSARFRPNLLVEGVPAWSEFDWIGKEICVGPRAQFRVLARTVRCKGVALSSEVDNKSDSHAGSHHAADAGGELDIISLLTQHFPQHGPYLGVYVQCTRAGLISVGDSVQLKRSWLLRWGDTVFSCLVQMGDPRKLMHCQHSTLGVLCLSFILVACCASWLW